MAINSRVKSEYSARVVGGKFDGKSLLADVVVSTSPGGSRLTIETGGEFGKIIGSVWGDGPKLIQAVGVLQQFVDEIRRAVLEGENAIEG